MSIARILRLIILASTAGGTASALAQTEVVTYVLEDVWLKPDISHPTAPAQPMTGTFEWTYDIGDFENGSGQFTEIYIPWWGSDMSELEFIFDVSSIEVTLVGNYHDRGVDITLFFVEPLSPDQPATIDTVRSIFDIQFGISHQGHVISGSVVPVIDACPGDLDGDSDVDLSDLAQMLANYGLSGGATYEQGDLDGDGDVDLADLSALLAVFGSTC